MLAYALPSRLQNTRPQHNAATEVISVTCSLVQVHTVSTHGESDARIWNSNATAQGYGPQTSACHTFIRLSLAGWMLGDRLRGLLQVG